MVLRRLVDWGGGIVCLVYGLIFGQFFLSGVGGQKKEGGEPFLFLFWRQHFLYFASSF